MTTTLRGSLEFALSAMLLMTMSCAQGTSQNDDTKAAQANTMKTAEEAARKAIQSLPQLITEANYRSMGFRSLDEVKSAQLGTASQRRTVSYDQLLKYQPGASLRSFFAGEEQVVYPVQVGGQARTTLAVSRRGNNWLISSIGDAYLAELFDTAGPSFEIISIPGLNMEFAGIAQGEEWTLIPAQDYPQLQLTRGSRVESATALPLIAAYAQEFDKQYGEQLRRRRLVK